MNNTHDTNRLAHLLFQTTTRKRKQPTTTFVTTNEAQHSSNRLIQPTSNPLFDHRASHNYNNATEQDTKAKIRDRERRPLSSVSETPSTDRPGSSLVSQSVTESSDPQLLEDSMNNTHDTNHPAHLFIPTRH